tara:strand:- start:577 stop:969 length:393 start_codon:yes stop_codon:yes gene_type:complete
LQGGIEVRSVVGRRFVGDLYWCLSGGRGLVIECDFGDDSVVVLYEKVCRLLCYFISFLFGCPYDKYHICGDDCLNKMYSSRCLRGSRGHILFIDFSNTERCLYDVIARYGRSLIVLPRFVLCQRSYWYIF